MIVLDTNVISSLMRKGPDAKIISWLDRLPEGSIWITAISIFELRHGLEMLAAGRRRRDLEDQFARVVETDIQRRILPFDEAAAIAASAIAAARQRDGRPTEIRDTLIAGIIVAHRADFATRNVRHFQDLDIRLIDPWAS